MTAMNLVVLYVTDLDRSCRFYEALGLGFAREQHAGGPVHYACESNGLVLELYSARAADWATAGKAVSLGFRVASLPAVLERIAGLGDGAVIPSSKPGATRLRLKDPDGHTIFVTAENDAAGERV